MSTSSKKNEVVGGGILLSLPQCDMKRPDTGLENTDDKRLTFGGVSGDIETKTKISIKTTTKKADLVLFQLPKSNSDNDGNSSIKIVDDLWEGRCQIFANNRSASIVSSSTSLQLITVGSSNTMILWKKEEEKEKKTGNEREEESPMKRLKKGGHDDDDDEINNDNDNSNTNNTIITNCRLVQPGGSGSSFLVGQSNELDPNELSRFFIETAQSSSNSIPTSTSQLCNLFQVSSTQLQHAMLRIPAVVSSVHVVHDDKAEKDGVDDNDVNDVEEYWQLVPEEEVLFGQQALVETLCEEDDDDNGGGGGDENESPSSKMTMKTMVDEVSQRLLPLLMENDNSKRYNGGDDNNNINNSKERRSLAIAQKTLLLASLSSSSKKTNFYRRRFKPDTSKIAFYVLRDLFMKYPSYAWSDLIEKWSTRLPIGEQYERITSTTEWIQDKNNGLMPNQLTFSSLSNDNEDKKSNNNINSSSKGVIRMINPHSVLIWMDDKSK